MKRSTKRRVRQGGLYAVLLAALLVVVLTINWTAWRDNFWASGLNGSWHDLILVGVKNTIVYTLIAFCGGFVLALALALMKLSDLPPYRWIAIAYIEFFRGLPALVVILVMAFGVPIAFHWYPPGGSAGAGILALMMVYSAYMAETLRAGIQAVPKGQVEAARSLGMSGGRTMFSIVLPQAIRIVIPPLTNELVALIKDTSLLFLAGLTAGQRELTSLAQDLMTSGGTSGTATSLTQVSIFYLVITLPLTQLVAWMERKQRRATR